jgi:hypothetical protein
MLDNLNATIERKFPGAVHLGLGKYAVLAEDQEHYFVIDYAEILKPHGPHMVIDLPDWWSPEKPYAVRNINTGEIVRDGVLRGSPLAYQGITVDPETGALIAADLTNVPREQFIHE